MSKIIITAVIARRKAAQVSQSQAAAMAGVSLKTYQRIERRESDIKLRNYLRLLEGLKITVLDIYLDCLNIENASAGDVVAAARLLPARSRLLFIKLLLSIRSN